MRGFATQLPRRASGGYALFSGRLEPEKGLDVGDRGLPDRRRAAARRRRRVAAGALRGHAERRPSRATLPERTLAELRAGAALALMPSRTAETFGMAAAEAMAAGLPVAASDIGALPELVPRDWLSAPGDAAALAGTIGALAADPGAGPRALAHARAILDPERLAATLASIYS